jgi:DNA-binding transcriptional ArsR family regulator
MPAMPSPDPLSDTFYALADPTRREILARLAQGDATVGELAEPFDLSLAAVSKHVQVLERANLISKGRLSQWRPCHLEPVPLHEVADWIDSYRKFWEASLDGLESYLHRLKQQRRN